MEKYSLVKKLVGEGRLFKNIMTATCHNNPKTVFKMIIEHCDDPYKLDNYKKSFQDSYKDYSRSREVQRNLTMERNQAYLKKCIKREDSLITMKDGTGLSLGRLFDEVKVLAPNEETRLFYAQQLIDIKNGKDIKSREVPPYRSPRNSSSSLDSPGLETRCKAADAKFIDGGRRLKSLGD
jgi:hypothetical protein